MARKSTKSPSRRPASAPKAKRASSARATQQQASSDDSISFARARDIVSENVNLQTAGFALAGAGILALISTEAGRSLVSTAAKTVAKLATDSFGEYFGSEEEETTERQTPSRQRDQARI